MRNRILVPSVSTMLLEILTLSGACRCDCQPWEDQHSFSGESDRSNGSKTNTP